MRGYPAPGQKTREGVARPVAASPRGGSGYRNDADTADNLIAYGGNNTTGPIDVATALNAHGGPHGRCDFESETFVAQAFNNTGQGWWNEAEQSATVRKGDDAGGGGSRESTLALAGMQVRRLTPRECARLQGFPDDWCAIQWRGKPAADGPMYRAYGNSMAVPVLRWLLTRIEAQADIRHRVQGTAPLLEEVS